MQDHTIDRTSPKRCSHRKRALFLLILLAGAGGTVEVGTRIYLGLTEQNLSDKQYTYAWRRNKRIAHQWPGQLRDYPYLPCIPKTKAPDVEMPGLRLTSPQEVKPANVFRIFCLGGSTTYWGYPARLEKQLSGEFAARGLQLEIVNAADISWTTCETFINFTMRCLHYQPDAIIVYHAVNDAWPAFGKTFKPDYAHWRKRLIPNQPLAWDRVPRVMDNSAAYVMLRGWSEEQANLRTWPQTMMHYTPDFANDPYHGVETFRSNMRNLIAVAQANDVEIMLATQVYNGEVPEKRLVDSVKEINDITRELANEKTDVHLVDVAGRIRGNYELMYDICHFRKDKDGEQQLVQILAESITSILDSWTVDRQAPQTTDPNTRLAAKNTDKP